MQASASIVVDFAGLRDLERAWTAAAAREPAPSPTVLHAWNHGMMARHASCGGFRILVLKEDEKVVLCLPYLVEKKGRLTRLRATSEITPVLCPHPAPALFDRALEILAALHGRHALLLEHAEVERPEVAGLMTAARARYAAVETRRTDANVIVDLSPGWPAVRAGLSGNAREALRRAHAKLRRLGLEPTFRTCSEPGEMGEAFAELLAVDARSWKYLRGGAMAVSANEHTQFAFAFQKLSAAGQARVFLLTLGGRVAAFILTIVIGDRAYMAIWSYDEAFSACSPGRLIMEKALSELAASGIRQVDFWGRPDSFKTSWSRDAVERSSVTFHPDRTAFLAGRRARAVLAPVRRFLQGPAERYRLRHPVGGRLREAFRPLKAPIDRHRRRRGGAIMPLTLADRQPADGVVCRPMSEMDKLRLPPGASAVGGSWVFERDGCPVGVARAEAWPDRCLHVEGLWLARDDDALRLACARALLDAYPEARSLLESRSELILMSSGGLGAALLGARP